MWTPVLTNDFSAGKIYEWLSPDRRSRAKKDPNRSRPNSGPRPLLFCTSSGALAATSSSTTSVLPSNAAWCSGVSPRPNPNTLRGQARGLPFFGETSSRSRSISTKSIWKILKKTLSAQSWQSPFNLFCMRYLQMVNRPCSKPKSLEGAGFSPSFRYIWKPYENPMWDSIKTRVDICRLNNQKSPNIHVKASYLHLELFAEVEKECFGCDRTKFSRRSPTAEAPGHRSSARPPAPWPWEAAGPPPRGRCVPQSAAGSSLSPEPGLWMCIRASTLQSSVPSCWSRCLLQGLFHSLHVWSDWPKSTSPITVSSLSRPCRYNKSNLLNPLNSLTQSAQTYSALMRHIDTACRESRFKTCRMCSSIFWAEGYREYMAKPCVKSMAKENEHHITTVSGDRRLASPRSWEMHRVSRMVCLESFLKGLKLSYFFQLSKLEVKE